MMNTAAGPVSTSPLQLAAQLPADPAAPLTTEGGDFTAALAAACMDDPETALPDGVESAAALAWLAGMVSVATPVEPAQPATDVADGAGEGVAAGIESGEQLASSVANSIIASRSSSIAVNAAPGAAPGATAAAVQNEVPADALAAALMDAPVESGAESSAAAPSGDQPDAPPAAKAAAADASRNTGIGVEDVAARAPMPLALMRVLAAHARPETPAAQTSAAAVAAAAVAGGLQTDAPVDAGTPIEASTPAERVVGAIFERAPAPAGAADFDPHSSAGSNLYANTRETLVSSNPQVAARSEVVHSTVGSPRWANEIGSRLMMMSVRGQQEGSLSLTPEHLGPLEVRISVNQDTTNVWFGAQHADTRAALTEALPKLREMFSASGLALGQAGVSHEMPRQDTRRGEFAAAARPSGETEVASAAPAAPARHIRSALLDAWA